MASSAYTVTMLHNVQVQSGNGWRGSSGLGLGYLANELSGFEDVAPAEITAITNADGHMDVFLNLGVQAGPGGNISLSYAFWQKAAGSESWGGAAAPAAGVNLTTAFNADNRLSLFATDAGGNIQHAWQTRPGLGPWQNKAFGGLAKRLTATSAAGSINLFYIGMDDCVYHNWQATPNAEIWSYQKFVTPAKRIAAARNVDGRMEVILIGLDDNIYSLWQVVAGRQDEWKLTQLLGQAKELAVIDNDDGRLEVVYIGLDSGIYHLWQTAPASGPWSGSGLGGFARQLTLTKNHDGRLEYFYIGSDQRLYHNWQVAKNSNWSGNDPQLDAGGLGNRVPFCVAATRDANGNLAVFYPTLIPPQPDPDGPGDMDGGGGPMDPVSGGNEVDQPD